MNTNNTIFSKSLTLFALVAFFSLINLSVANAQVNDVKVPPTADAGKDLPIGVASGVSHILVFIPGEGSTLVKVKNGTAIFSVPAVLPSGTTIYVSDQNYPNPSSGVSKVN